MKILTGFSAAILLVIAGCEKEKNPEKKGVFVSTSNITNITTVSATTGGDVDFVGDENITERGISWATTPKPTTDNNKVIANGSGAGNFIVNISGLTMGTDYYVRAYVISNGKTYYGNEIKFAASTPVELLKNGDFKLPDDNVKYLSINSIPEWKTDETNAGLTGRGFDYWRNSGAAFVNDWAKSIYQVVSTVPSVKSDYDVKFDANISWTAWGDYKPKYVVKFSAFSGNDPKTRVPIGTIEFDEPEFYGSWPGHDWGPTRTGKFSIPAASAFVGQNLVIEFDVLPYDDGSSGWDPDLWYDFDNFSVIQTLR